MRVCLSSETNATILGRAPPDEPLSVKSLSSTSELLPAKIWLASKQSESSSISPTNSLSFSVMGSYSNAPIALSPIMDKRCKGVICCKLKPFFCNCRSKSRQPQPSGKLSLNTPKRPSKVCLVSSKIWAQHKRGQIYSGCNKLRWIFKKDAWCLFL